MFVAIVYIVISCVHFTGQEPLFIELYVPVPEQKKAATRKKHENKLKRMHSHCFHNLQTNGWQHFYYFFSLLFRSLHKTTINKNSWRKKRVACMLNVCFERSSKERCRRHTPTTTKKVHDKKYVAKPTRKIESEYSKSYKIHNEHVCVSVWAVSAAWYNVASSTLWWIFICNFPVCRNNFILLLSFCVWCGCGASNEYPFS